MTSGATIQIRLIADSTDNAEAMLHAEMLDPRLAVVFWLSRTRPVSDNAVFWA